MRLRLFKRAPSVDAVLLVQAEEISEELGQIEQFIQAAGWDIDSALSSIRKDDAGYRMGNAANREGGANYVEGELEEAVRNGRRLLLALSPCRQLIEGLAERKALAYAVRPAA
jgi:hypothetical protein